MQDANLLSVIKTYINYLLMCPDRAAGVWHLRQTQPITSMWYRNNFPQQYLTAIVNNDTYHQSPLMDKWETLLYV